MRILAITTLAVIYATMVIGSYVSAIGAGLACPDWPLCPFPTSWGVLMELTHRILAMLSFLFAVITTVKLLRNGNTRARTAALVGFIALIFQAFLIGAVVIYSALHPVLIAFHMAAALIVFASYTAATIYTFME